MDGDGLTGSGMEKGQLSGVETLTGLAQLWLFSAIDHVAENGMILPGQVDPNLMGTSGFQTALQMRIAGKPLENLPMRDSGLAVFFSDCHAFAVDGVAADGSVDCAAVLLDSTDYDAFVGPGQSVVFELGRQRLMRKIVFCDDEKA